MINVLFASSFQGCGDLGESSEDRFLDDIKGDWVRSECLLKTDEAGNDSYFTSEISFSATSWSYLETLYFDSTCDSGKETFVFLSEGSFKVTTPVEDTISARNVTFTYDEFSVRVKLQSEVSRLNEENYCDVTWLLDEKIDLRGKSCQSSSVTINYPDEGKSVLDIVDRRKDKLWLGVKKQRYDEDRPLLFEEDAYTKQ